MNGMFHVEHPPWSIGGSTCAAALGLSRYQTPHALWLEITGRAERQNISDREHIIWGNALENAIAVEFGRRTGRPVYPSPGKLFHVEHRWISGTPDRMLDCAEGLEIKTAGLHTVKQWGEPGSDDIPIHYLIQCMHYIMLTDSVRWHLAVLIGGRDYRHYVIERNDELIARIMRGLHRFKSYVDTDMPPPPATSEDCNDIWALATSDEPVIANTDIESVYKKLAQLMQREDEIRDEIDACKLTIKNALGEKSTLCSRDGEVLATWKNRMTKRLDTKLLSQDNPQLVEKYTRAHASRYLIIKR